MSRGSASVISLAVHSLGTVPFYTGLLFPRPFEIENHALRLAGHSCELPTLFAQDVELLFRQQLPLACVSDDGLVFPRLRFIDVDHRGVGLCELRLLGLGEGWLRERGLLRHAALDGHRSTPLSAHDRKVT